MPKLRSPVALFPLPCRQQLYPQRAINLGGHARRVASTKTTAFDANTTQNRKSNLIGRQQQGPIASFIHRSIMSQTGRAAAGDEKPWYEAFPPSSWKAKDVPAISRRDILAQLKTGGGDASDLKFLLVDVRRADHVGGQIRGSLNVPAQSMYYSMPTLYELFKRSGVGTVVWFCGSSHGRGPRAAGWFHDYCVSRGDSSMQNAVLEGGIKGWVAAGPEYQEWMDGFDAKAWESRDDVKQ